jgi:hypothetical protein
VAIRSLPYDWIITMNGEGRTPFFEAASRQSYFTRLEPFPTPHWRALWASLATGKLPNRHGVTGRFSYRTPLNRGDRDERFILIPSGVGFRAWGLVPPVERISARLPSGDARPLWSMFERLGASTRVIRWPATAGTTTGAQQLAPLPDDIASRFAATGNARPAIAGALAGDLAALDAADTAHDADLVVVALEGLAAAQRALGINGNTLPEATTARGEAMRAYAEQLDRRLAALVRDHPDHLVVIVSPSAVAPPELAASAYAIAARALARPDPGADDGFALLAGRSIVYRANPATAYIADIVPTILFAAGLPVGRDMDGRIIVEAFGEEFLRRTTVSAIPTYEAEQVVVRRRGA